MGILGECCQDGACGGLKPDVWRQMGYVFWGLSILSVCSGIATSQKGNDISNDMNQDPEAMTAKLV